MRAATVGDSEGLRETLAEREGMDTEARPEFEAEGVTEGERLGLPLTELERAGLREVVPQEEAEVESVRVRVAASVKLCVWVRLLLGEGRVVRLREKVPEPVRLTLLLPELLPEGERAPEREADREELGERDGDCDTLGVREDVMVTLGEGVREAVRDLTLAVRDGDAEAVAHLEALTLSDSVPEPVGEPVTVGVLLPVMELEEVTEAEGRLLAVMDVELVLVTLMVGVRLPVRDTSGVLVRHSVLLRVKLLEAVASLLADTEVVRDTV